MPGKDCSCAIVAGTSPPGCRCSAPDCTAWASDRIACCRCLTMPRRPNASGDSAASVAASGKQRSKPSGARASGMPQWSTSRAVRVRAAFTVICWPKMARTASSSPSRVPGTRMPSLPAKSGHNIGSIAAGSASRSSQARMRVSTTGRAQARDSLMRSCTRCWSLAHCASTQPRSMMPLWGTLIERRINPFLRSHEPALAAAAQAHDPASSTDALAVFTILRAWKNVFA